MIVISLLAINHNLYIHFFPNLPLFFTKFHMKLFQVYSWRDTQAQVVPINCMFPLSLVRDFSESFKPLTNNFFSSHWQNSAPWFVISVTSPVKPNALQIADKEQILVERVSE